jgi:DNA-binding winged helix-turn-helix (wHTH) protein/Tfp pilus assembly protein PilF
LLLNRNDFNHLRYYGISPSMTVYRFGEFRADPGSRRLDWRETPVSLTAKQFDLLLAFLERPGAALSKQELQQRVWPDTFVEENNLTQHIFQLRKALGAVGGDTVYIETLPKVGYQFVAPVAAEEIAPEIVPGRAPAWRWVAAAVAMAVLAATVGFGKRQWDFWMAEDEASAEAPKSIAVMPFLSAVGGAFAAELAGSLGRLDNIQVQVVQPTAFGTRADFTLSGTIEGDKVRAELRQDGKAVWTHELTGELAEIQSEIATYTAVSLQELGGARRRNLLSRRAPANREAYLAYLEGAQALTSRKGSAVDSFQRSLAADPAFAGAYSGIALHYTLMGINQMEDPRVVWERAREYSRKALELEAENGDARMIQAYVAAYADQNELKAERLAREVLQSDPGSISLQLLAGQLLARLGRFTESERILRGAVQGDPTLLLGRQVLAHHYYLSRQYDLAKREACDPDCAEEWDGVRAVGAAGVGDGGVAAGVVDRGTGEGGGAESADGLDGVGVHVREDGAGGRGAADCEEHGRAGADEPRIADAAGGGAFGDWRERRGGAVDGGLPGERVCEPEPAAD